MKYKLLKDLPLAKAGTEVYLERNSTTTSKIHAKGVYDLGSLVDTSIPEWLEEVKEPNTIYDLKKGDTYWNITEGYISDHKVISNFQERPHIENFITEREAKRNKLLRELATRTDKWLPEDGDAYYTFNRYGDVFKLDFINEYDIYTYHSGFVFRNEEEYSRWMTEEVKDLLFKI